MKLKTVLTLSIVLFVISLPVDQTANAGISWRTPLGKTGAGVTWKTPLGRNGAGVTLRTPVGRNGLGYQPLKKPLGAYGKDLEKWINKNQGLLIVAAVTIVSIAILQPELSSITWTDVGITASSDGFAVGVTLHESGGKLHARSSSSEAPDAKPSSLPLWPLGLPANILQTIESNASNELDNELINELVRFVDNKDVRNRFLAALDAAEKINWPSTTNPPLVRQIILTNRDAVRFGDFVSDYMKKNNGLVGIDKDPTFQQLWQKAGDEIVSLKKLAGSDEALRQSVTSMDSFLKSQVAAKQSASEATGGTSRANSATSRPQSASRPKLPADQATANPSGLGATVTTGAVLFKPPSGKVTLNVALGGEGHVWLRGSCAGQAIFFSFGPGFGPLKTTEYAKAEYAHFNGDVSKTFTVSLEQCHKMFGEIVNIQDETFYNVVSRNCTTEALKVLAAAGIDLGKPVKVRLPDNLIKDGEIWTPRQLAAKVTELNTKKPIRK